jgi:hypothetical protein
MNWNGRALRSRSWLDQRRFDQVSVVMREHDSAFAFDALRSSPALLSSVWYGTGRTRDLARTSGTRARLRTGLPGMCLAAPRQGFGCRNSQPDRST